MGTRVLGDAGRWSIQASHNHRNNEAINMILILITKLTFRMR